jgi:hypothetical protein
MANSARHGRLAAGLAAAWEAEVNAARTLGALAERIPFASHRARLLVLAAFCRAHASRLLARLTAMGRGPLPVPSEDDELEEADLKEALDHEAKGARTAAARYAQLALMARSSGDVSSAWVCELNRSEEEERAKELLQMGDTLSATPGETAQV